MKKIFFVLAIALVGVFGLKIAIASDFLNNPPKADATILGEVLDFTSGESLAGVTVSIEGTSLETYTDLDGNFEFKGVMPGDYNLVFSFISYNNSLVEQLEVKPSEARTLKVKMQESL
jgi:hypothetical protein